MGTNKLDYNGSGLSTQEAIADARNKTPRLLRPFMIMSMVCDGIGCHRVGRTNGRLSGVGAWRLSNGWKHINDLDFCPRCQENGTTEETLAAGVKPRGAE